MNGFEIWNRINGGIIEFNVENEKRLKLSDVRDLDLPRSMNDRRVWTITKFGNLIRVLGTFVRCLLEKRAFGLEKEKR